MFEHITEQTMNQYVTKGEILNTRLNSFVFLYRLCHFSSETSQRSWRWRRNSKYEQSGGCSGHSNPGRTNVVDLHLCWDCRCLAQNLAWTAHRANLACINSLAAVDNVKIIIWAMFSWIILNTNKSLLLVFTATTYPFLMTTWVPLQVTIM